MTSSSLAPGQPAGRWLGAWPGAKSTSSAWSRAIGFPSLLPKNHLDWEVRARRSWSPSPNIRQWPSDYPVASYGDDPISVFIYNAVGGSTIGYAGNFWRFTPSDFRVRSLDGVAVDWPIGYDDLAPYYTINEREMGVAGLAGDPGVHPGSRCRCHLRRWGRKAG